MKGIRGEADHLSRSTGTADADGSSAVERRRRPALRVPPPGWYPLAVRVDLKRPRNRCLFQPGHAGLLQRHEHDLALRCFMFPEYGT